MTDNSTKQQRRRERRLYLWDLWNQGYALRECVQQTAEAFGCSERLCYYDWEQRHYWLCQEGVLGSLDRFYIEHLAGLQATLRQAQAHLHLLKDSDHTGYKIAYLKLIRQCSLDLLKHGQAILKYLNRGSLLRADELYQIQQTPFWKEPDTTRPLDEEEESEAS